MFRKVLAATTAALLVSVTLSIAPASAAVKNGTPCSKAGATTKSGGSTFKCTKYALIKNSKLTWLSTECLTAITQYNAAVKARKSVANSSEQVAELNVEYEKAVTALASVTTAYDNARAQVTKSQAAMNAATVASEKQALATALSKLANAVLVLSGSKSKLSAQVKDLEAKRELISSAPATFKESVAEAKGSASLLCKKGF